MKLHQLAAQLRKMTPQQATSIVQGMQGRAKAPAGESPEGVAGMRAFLAAGAKDPEARMQEQADSPDGPDSLPSQQSPDSQQSPPNPETNG